VRLITDDDAQGATIVDLGVLPVGIGDSRNGAKTLALPARQVSGSHRPHERQVEDRAGGAGGHLPDIRIGRAGGQEEGVRPGPISGAHQHAEVAGVRQIVGEQKEALRADMQRCGVNHLSRYQRHNVGHVGAVDNGAHDAFADHDVGDIVLD